MKKNRLILSILLLASLSACNNNNDSSSSNSLTLSNSSDKVSTNTNSSVSTNSSSNLSTSTSSSSTSTISGSIYFEQLETLFNQLYVDEVYESSVVTIKETEVANSITTIRDEEFVIFNDYTSASSGSLVQTLDGEVSKEDTFKSRKTKTIDRIEVNGNINDYDMFVNVIDYENNSFPLDVDDASKLYIIDSQLEAEEAGLEDDQYVLPLEVIQYSTAQINPNLYEKIGVNLMANPYALQAGASSFKYTSLENGDLYYTCNVKYNVDGDLDDVIYTDIQYSFTTNADQTRLINASCIRLDRDVSNIDETDVYETESRWEVEITYGEREEISQDLLNVDDYFLETVEDIQLFVHNAGKKYVESNKVPSSSTYLFAEAKTFTPNKAVNIGLSNYSSSNSEVITLENGYFKIQNAGTTELSFAYFGKDVDGVYREKVFTKSVTVTNSYPQSIRILNTSPSIVDDTLEIGVTYTLNMFVGPDTKTDQSIQILSNSAEDIVSVVVNKNNDVEVTALKEGTATIVIASGIDESIYIEKTFIVAPDLDYSTIITKNTYYCSYTGGNYTATMNFSSDGTGTLVLHLDDESEEYNYTFTYTINKRTITFISWSSETFEGCKMDYATITEEGNKITGEVESYYKQMEFVKVES